MGGVTRDTRPTSRARPTGLWPTATRPEHDPLRRHLPLITLSVAPPPSTDDKGPPLTSRYRAISSGPAIQAFTPWRPPASAPAHICPSHICPSSIIFRDGARPRAHTAQQQPRRPFRITCRRRRHPQRANTMPLWHTHTITIITHHTHHHTNAQPQGASDAAPLPPPHPAGSCTRARALASRRRPTHRSQRGEDVAEVKRRELIKW